MESTKPLLCTKCKTEPRVDQKLAATNRHCQKCRAEAHRTYMQTKSEQEVGSGWARGVKDMREFLAEQFAKYRIQTFDGPTIASIIRQCAPPTNRESADGEISYDSHIAAEATGKR